MHTCCGSKASLAYSELSVQTDQTTYAKGLQKAPHRRHMRFPRAQSLRMRSWRAFRREIYTSTPALRQILEADSADY